MRYVAAYLLANLGGNENPSAADIKKILKSVGIETEDSRVEALLSQVSGKDINAVIAQGYGKLASMPAGGAAAAPAASASSAAPAAAAAGGKKEEAKKVEKEESDEEMGFGLFD